METTALILSIILFIAGLLGTILPILPGAVLIYGGMLLYGFMTKFASLDVNFFLLQALVLILIFSIDFLASAAGTRRSNGSKQAAWGAVIGTIFGIISFGPLGIVIGPFLGAVIAELVRGIELNQAIRVGFGTLIGILGGTVLKLCAEILMIVYFFMRI
ncbi:DUF456 domain-containing protein [Desulfosporosinus youngiae]|uniref:DUF456 domain-containing protein n=1 Tax=Desulfosporosinus youngiae DSM 17734 TaxID=768710 RepID=H5Y1J4_9FIRM|nr:DUF456 domain-containing protein [Desulfosporosinus youngiae]EHQ87607.1 hypothetical protein DesyoDRAFT_0414 [Desulfosporosinus youngiae DSM 17734]